MSKEVQTDKAGEKAPSEILAPKYLEEENEETFEPVGDQTEITVETFRQFIKLEQDMEAAREQLAMKSDFNLIDAYRHFDEQEKGQVAAY